MIRVFPVLVLVACNSSGIGKDTGADADTDADADADTDTDTDTDSDTDQDPGCHPYEPFDAPGWTKVFDVTFLGASGSETWIGQGQSVSPAGDPAFQIDQKLESGSGLEWDVQAYYDCDTDGQPGVYGIGWEGTADASATLTDRSIVATEQPAHKMLPAPSEVGAGSSWSYNYNITWVDSVLGGIEFPVQGTTTEVEIDDVTVPAGTYTDCLHIRDEFTENRTTLINWGEAGYTINGTRDAWYCPGVGLVKDVLLDGTDTRMERELTSTVKL